MAIKDNKLTTNDEAIKLSIMKLAQSNPVKLVDCINHITSQILELDSQMGISPSLSPKRLGLEERIKNCCDQLFATNLLVYINEIEFCLTAFGKEIVDKTPVDIAEKPLTSPPKHNCSLRQVTGGLSAPSSSRKRYDEGFTAFRGGENYTTNPYPNDQAEHLAWHNGWAEALKNEEEHDPLHKYIKGSLL